ncbi:MAG: gliding motility lipoprotein GldD [Bacteroidota bacterium]|nr:gliding motility lipoprotein GldD [Bacteroidota bacterium]
MQSNTTPKQERKKNTFVSLVITFIFILIITSSCDEDYTPRPRGYFRLTLPVKSYKEFKSACDFSFKHPTYTIINIDHDYNAEACWYNLDFPLFHARLHISYKPVENNLSRLLEDSYTLAMKHSAKADAINQNIIYYPDRNVFGIKYNINGNAASMVQFVLTDSIDNFFRGALYFNHPPNKDSIAPVLEFIDQDIDSLIKSFKWK